MGILHRSTIDPDRTDQKTRSRRGTSARSGDRNRTVRGRTVTDADAERLDTRQCTSHRRTCRVPPRGTAGRIRDRVARFPAHDSDESTPNRSHSQARRRVANSVFVAPSTGSSFAAYCAPARQAADFRQPSIILLYFARAAATTCNLLRPALSAPDNQGLHHSSVNLHPLPTFAPTPATARGRGRYSTSSHVRSSSSPTESHRAAPAPHNWYLHPTAT